MDDDDTTAITTTTTTMFTTNEEEEEDYCNWLDLHEDMILLIFKRFTTEADYIRLGSVCVSWRSMQFLCLHPDLLHPQLPLLMIPTPPSSKPIKLEEETRSFYRVSEKSVYKDLQISLPYSNRFCRGSSHGWLITSGKQDTGYSVELFNPFISVNGKYQKIQLPPLTAFPGALTALGAINNYINRIDYLYKAIVSVNPSTHPKDYVVMAIYSGVAKLGFWRPGDQVWTHVHLGGINYIAIDDVIYYKGLFYAVNANGSVVVIEDLDAAGSAGAGAGVRRLTPGRVIRIPGSFKSYLVESEGDLLLVGKSSDRYVEDNMVFTVLKLVSDDDDQNGVFKWNVVKTLPGRMLFLGDNASISLAASDFPGGKSSCIYFTEDSSCINFTEDEHLCAGIFSMEENKMIEKLDYIYSANTIWVEPTLRSCFRL